jgi:HSP20 family molecular chaperone IbpA
MNTIKKYYKEPICSYPGDNNVDIFKWDEFMEEIRNSTEPNSEPKVNMEEHAGHYKMEIAAPKHQREDFVVGASGNKLAVLAQKPAENATTCSVHMHELKSESFTSIFDLPNNLDSDFIRAEYNAGVLSFYFPKSTDKTFNTAHRIVIY